MGCSRYDFSKDLDYVPDGSIVIAADGDSFNYRISSLEKRTAYRVRVSSINDVGRGITRMSIALPALMIPSKPIYNHVMLHTTSTREAYSTSLIIQFEPSFEDRQWTDSFDIEFGHVSLKNVIEYANCEQAHNASLSCVTIESTLATYSQRADENATYMYERILYNLIPGKEYFFRVYTVIANRRGRSRLSDPLSIIPPIQTPNAPIDLYVTHINGSSLFVSWKVPDFDGGSKIKKYRVEYRQVSPFNCSSINNCSCELNYSNDRCGEIVYNFTKVEHAVDSTTTHIVEITRLKMGVFYNVNITACNAIGCGLTSSHNPVKTMQPPEIPTRVEQAIHNYSTLSILYSPPVSNGGDAISSYFIAWAEIFTDIKYRQLNSTNETNSTMNTSEIAKRYQFLNGVHEIVTPTLFKNYEETTARKYYENCSCLETTKNNVSYGGCCCDNSDCQSNVCHPRLGYCTALCSTVADCHMDPIVQSVSENMCSSDMFCEVRCPFDTLNKLSPCSIMLQKNVSSPPCVIEDFSYSWIRSKKIGYHNSTIPRQSCIRYILIYCSIIAPNDPACKWDSILNIGKQIPKCKQRKPRSEFVGIRANSLITSLEPNHRYFLRISACNSAGCGLNVSIGMPIAPMPQILLSESKQCVVEGKENDTYSVVLNSRPSSPIALYIDGVADELENMRRKIIFDKSNWSVPVDINVLALNDDYDDVETLTSNLVHSIKTQDAVYDLYQDYIPKRNITIEIKDNDYSGVLIWNTSVITSEVGLKGSYEVQLRSRPLHDVAFTMNSGEDIFIHPETIIFRNSIFDYRVNHTVNVTARPDDYDDPLVSTSIITHTSSTDDSNYYNIHIPDVSVTVIDEDTAGVVLTPNVFYEVDEGGRVTYDIKLTAQPRTPVLILISLNPASDGMLAKTPSQYIGNESSLSFSTSVIVRPNGHIAVLPAALLFDVGKENWMVPKTFTLNIDDDDIDLGVTYNTLIQHVAISDDATYNCEPCSDLITPVFNVSINDNDVAGILLSRKNLVVTEDGTRAHIFFVELESAPRSIVVIQIKSLKNQVVVSPSQITFTSFNYMIQQKVNVSAFDDGILETQVHFDKLVYEITTDDKLFQKIVLEATNLRIIDASAVVDTSPPPSVLSMVQADNIKEIHVTFDRPAYVELIGIEHSEDCNEFFSTRTAKLFGTGAFCYWHSRTQLRVREGTPLEKHVVPGSKLALLGGVIRSTLTSVIFSEGTYVLQPRLSPPEMTYAYYGDTGTELFVNFTGYCYGGFHDVAGATLCTNVFANSDKLGGAASCSWISPCLLRISLGFGSSIQPAFGLNRCGTCECQSCLPTPAYVNYPEYATKCSTSEYACTDEFCYCSVSSDISKEVLCPEGRSLSLIPDAVKPIRHSILSASGCIKIDVPPNVVEPTASIIALPHASICNDLTIDGTNSITSGGGRDDVTWSVASIYTAQGSAGSDYRTYFTESLNNISNAASSVQALRLSVPRDVLVVGFNGGIREIAVALTIENILGEHSSKSLKIAMSDSDNFYPIILMNDTTKIRRSEQLIVNGAVLPTCGTDSIIDVKFNWYITKNAANGKVNVVDTSIIHRFDGSKVIKIPAFFFESNMKYTIELQINKEGYSQSAFRTIIVLLSSIHVDVGALQRQQSVYNTFSLDASRSISDDISPDQYGTFGNKLKFVWSCSRRSGHGCAISYGINTYASEDGSALNFPAFTFTDVSEPYLFSVNVEFLGNSAMKTVAVQFVEVKGPSVDIKSPIMNKINTDKRFVLNGILEDDNVGGKNYVLHWEETSGYLNEQKEIQSVYGSPLDRISLVILPNSFLPGRSYSFRLSATNTEGTNYAEVSIRTNKPPSSGYIETYPEIAISSTTQFVTYTNSWADDIEDLPFTYLFSFIDVDNNDTIIPISTGPSFSTEIKHLLPYLKGVKLYKMVVTVTDNLGASFSTSKRKDGSTMIVKVISANTWNHSWYTGMRESDQYLSMLDELNHNDLSFKVISLAETLSSNKACDDDIQKCNNQTERHYVNSTCSEGFQRNMDHNSNYGKYPKLRLSPCQCKAAWTGKYCHLKKNEVDRRVKVRKDLMTVLKSRFEDLLVTEAVIQQQVLCINSIMDTPSEIDLGIVEDGISHLHNLFAPREFISVTDAAPIVVKTLQTIVTSARLPGRNADILSNKSHSGYLGDRSHVAGLILNLTASISRALLNHHVSGEFHLTLKSDDITMWAKREAFGGSYTINLDRNLGSVEAASINIDTSTYAMSLNKIDICAAALNLHYRNSVGNAIVSIEIFDGDKVDSGAVEWKELQVPVTLSIPVSPLFNGTVKDEKALCSYWDNKEKAWVVDGIFTEGKAAAGNTYICQSTHLSQFALMSRIIPSTPTFQKYVGDIKIGLYTYDTFNWDTTIVMTVYSGLLVLTCVAAIYITRKSYKMTSHRDLKSFLLFGSTKVAQRRPLVYLYNRTPVNFCKRVKHGFKTNHLLFACINDLIMRRALSILSLMTFTGAAFLIMCLSAYTIGTIETKTIDPGVSYTNLDPHVPIINTTIAAVIAIYFLMLVKNHILTTRSNFGRVINVSSGSTTFVWEIVFKMIRYLLFGSSKVHRRLATSYDLIQGLSLYKAGPSSAKRWRNFEVLHIRALKYATRKDVAKRRLKSGDANNPLHGTTHSYERYVVDAIMHGSTPLSREIYNCATTVQAMWRGYSVRMRRRIFEAHYYNILKAQETINEKFLLPAFPQNIKTVTLLLQSLLTSISFALLVYSLYSYQYIFLTPYASASLILGFFCSKWSNFWHLFTQIYIR
jgi:hypothetical protein